MGTVKRLLGYFVSILILLVACSKDSDSDSNWQYEEDPRFSGYMEAKVNGELKKWETAAPFIPHDYRCFNYVSCGYLGNLPDITETIAIRFDVSESYGCGEFDASYAIAEGKNLTYYGSRDLCEDDDPFTPTTYICHDVSFTINNIGNNIYKGTFSFTASRNCGEEVVVITDGKFEIESRSPMCDYN